MSNPGPYGSSKDSAYKKRYAAANRASISAARKAWRKAHPDYWKKEKQRHFEKHGCHLNPEQKKRRLAHQRLYNQKNRDKVLARQRDWQRDNRVEMNAYRVAWAKLQKQKDPEGFSRKSVARTRRWQKKNPEKVRFYHHNKSVRRRLRIACTKDESNSAAKAIRVMRAKKTVRCYLCGRKLPRKLAHIEHLQALSKNGQHRAENVAMACPSCNHSKRTTDLKDWCPPTGQPLLPL